MIELLLDAIENTWALLLFGGLLLSVCGAVLLTLLFAGLAIRIVWHWLTRRTWGNVIVYVERKALRRS